MRGCFRLLSFSIRSFEHFSKDQTLNRGSHLPGSAGFYGKHIAKAKHRGRKKPYVEQTVGDDLDRKSSRWMKLHRRIDRDRKWYDERITDP